MIAVLDNPYYYLDNFQRALDWVAARDGDLLDETEHGFIARFGRLPQAARALFVRMVMRKGELFRSSKLRYPEIGDTDQAAAPLVEAGWVRADPEIELPELFELLQKPEIAAVFALAGAEKSLRKAEQLQMLGERHDGAAAFSHWWPGSGDTLYRIELKPLCERLRLLFFGNFHQDWTDFVLADLGLYQYETVDLSSASRAFRARRDVDDYIALQRCRERLHELDDDCTPLETLAALLADLPAPDAGNAWLLGRRDKLRFQAAQQLEKLGDWEAALAVYRDCPYPGARHRAIRVLEKSQRHGEAWALLARATHAPESEAEHQLLLRMAPRLRRQLGHGKQAKMPAAEVERLDVVLPFPHLPCHVEGVVQAHLAEEHAPVFYVENALINSLFGLLCWRAIFKAVPGAFFHPYQRGPADLHAADFHRRRHDDFAACLAELDSGAYVDSILATWELKRGLQSPFVFWEVLDGGLLELALACIPAAHIRKWCERILLDVATNRSGLPDLIQFWPEERRYRMIEVKGPGDRLQDNQKRWIAYCQQHGIPVSVCYLAWREAA